MRPASRITSAAAMATTRPTTRKPATICTVRVPP
jgi:hypothetical protein